MDEPKPLVGGTRHPTPSETWRYWATAASAVVAVLVLTGAMYVARDALLLIFVSFVFGIGLQQPIDWLVRRGVRRGFALGLIVFGVLATVALFLALVIPTVTRSVQNLIEQGPDTIDKFRNQKWVANLDDRFDLTDKLQDDGSDLPSQVAGASLGLLTLSATRSSASSPVR